MHLDERFITHEGGRLRYLVGGAGPAILLCHGFIGAAENFEDWFGELLQRRTVIAPDLPGFGKSTPLRGRHTPAALARAAVAAAEDVGVDRYDLAGLCLGSSVAMSVMRLRPESAQRLILQTPLLNPSLIRTRYHVQVAVMTSGIVWPAIVWLGHQRVVSDLYKRIMVEGPDVDPVAAQVNFDNQMRATPRAAREWLRDGLRCDEMALLRQTTHPVMIIAARHDRLIDVPRVQRSLRMCDNVQLAVIEDAGHAWTAEMSAVQRRHVAAFLDGRPLEADADAA
ncbi:MAG: alpha/beta hydrolase [Candidatus Dormibacteraeota bacterium]|nr:alpha/beta hydrolase [Candidatus Dormibacteraeota bacterium]